MCEVHAIVGKSQSKQLSVDLIVRREGSHTELIPFTLFVCLVSAPAKPTSETQTI